MAGKKPKFKFGKLEKTEFKVRAGRGGGLGELSQTLSDAINDLEPTNTPDEGDCLFLPIGEKGPKEWWGRLRSLRVGEYIPQTTRTRQDKDEKNLVVWVQAEEEEED